MQFKTQDNILILKQVERLIYLDKIEEALQEVENLQNKVELNNKEKVQFQILRSLIFDKLGKYTTSLEIAEHAFQEGQRLENHILVTDAIISLANAKFRLDDFSTCLDVINKGEKLLITTNKGHEKEIIDRIASLKYLKGKVYWKRGELNQAYDLVRESFVKQDLENTYVTADNYNILGIICVNKGEYDQALNYLQKSLAMFEELGLKSSVVKSLNNIGQIYWRKGDLRQALENYKMSLTRSEELGNNQFIAGISLNIGLLFWNMGELDSALNFYNKSLEISKGIDHKSAMAACLNGIGMILQFKGELDQALEFYQKSLVLEEKLGKKLDVALCLNNIGEIHHIKGSFNEASDYYKKSLALFEEIGTNYHMCLALYNLVLV
ncbi:MAG: tetratricopeptide repeat protein, partial [Promethearchaeota archaeon]